MSNTSCCIGATLGGALANLIALGAVDAYLTMAPSVTYWRHRYNKHTNFALEAIEQTFQSQVSFGSNAQMILNRTGDLVYWMYVLIDLPGICAQVCTPGCGIATGLYPSGSPCDACGDGLPPDNCSTQPVEVTDDGAACTGLTGDYAYWTNAIGQFLVRRACLVIGGQVIDTLTNDFLYMWEELAGQPGKRLEEMIGKRWTVAQLVADSQEDRRLYVPLPFWFTLTSGNALPLVSLQFHGVQIHIEFEHLGRCIQMSSEDLVVVKSHDRQQITSNDLCARIETTYVYLDIEERDRFATGSFEQLINQLQLFSICTRSCQIRIQLNFNHPIIELIWAVRRKCQSLNNNHFNYSGKYGRDPVVGVNLRLNNLPRFSCREGRYFRLVQPYQFHTLIPQAYVYCYSFGLHPEEAQPSGSCNFSRIDNVEMILDLQHALQSEDVEVLVFGRNWNIFRYREGLAGIAFSS
jgi:hypothetical protein